MIFIIAVILGVMLGIIVPYNLTSSTLPYVAVAIIAALDSVFGGLAANFNKKFNMNVFMTGLISNAILAVLLTYMGDLLGINLFFAAIVVFGVRMFNNMAAMRRLTLDIYFEKKARENERLHRIAISEKAESCSDITEEDDSGQENEMDENTDADKNENAEIDETEIKKTPKEEK